MEITGIKGIGEKTAALFSKLNIKDTSDLIHYYPKDYDYFEPVIQIKDLSAGIHAVKAKCLTGPACRYIRGKSIITVKIGDESGNASIIYFNMPYIRSSLKAGEEHVFRGNVVKRGDSFIMNQPKMYKIEEYEKLSGTYQPVYSTTKGLSSNAIQKAVKKAFDAELQAGIYFEGSPLYDRLPEPIRNKRSLIDLAPALRNLHLPENMDSLIKARRRLAYQEFFDFILNIEKNRDKNYRHNDYPMIEVAETARLIDALPFELTEDQQKVWKSISEDMCSEGGCIRLVQGDVGSGKTIIAFLALVQAVSNGYQGALMAPTEVLAGQHLENLKVLIDKYKLPLKPVLLTGSVKGKARKELLEEISDGRANIIIGTHALFQEAVDYKALALVITDEQHRFGVLQREAFKEKGGLPHVIIMSATPIPRTLAQILYGDLDVSTIHSMPKGRLPIKNCVVNTSFRKKAYEFIEREVRGGSQVYIICPQVEGGETEALGLENVVDYTEKLKTYLSEDIRIQYLHGKMKPARKNQIMEDMVAGNIDVLVSTTVIEVGVNVPNATLMYVENAERFGLAQLHQLRGRVGRGEKQSYCIFMMGNESDKAKERLHILEKSNDGFEIAKKDMELRGPGDIFGIRQSGEMAFVIGDIYQDADLISWAAEDVKTYLG